MLLKKKKKEKSITLFTISETCVVLDICKYVVGNKWSQSWKWFSDKTDCESVVKSRPLFHFFACNEDVWGSISALKGSSPWFGPSPSSNNARLLPISSHRLASPRWRRRRRRNGPVLPLCYVYAMALASSCPTKKPGGFKRNLVLHLSLVFDQVLPDFSGG